MKNSMNVFMLRLEASIPTVVGWLVGRLVFRKIFKKFATQVVQSLVQDGATSVICVWHCTMQQRRQQG